MQVIQTSQPNRVIYSWCPDIEKDTLDNFKLLIEQPFIFRHGAFMPDAHKGITMPIGGVIATKNVVIPSCVGMDVSCGMCSIKTSLKVSNFSEGKKEELLHSMERSVPVGFAHNNEKRQEEIKIKFEEKIEYLCDKNKEIIYGNKDERKILGNNTAYSSVIEQVGTLGSGNHFIEIQYDEEDNIWVMIHSGSRNIGAKICKSFDNIAKELNKKYHSMVPESIPFLPTNTLEGKEYLLYMHFAMDFAFLNRQVMMDYIKKDISFAFKHMEVDFEKMINIHHNYASLENHFGENVWIHRKGATLATAKTMGIIPGSMGSSSYIVRGLGNPNSYMSCSHGAGRIMGRKEFNRRHNTPEKLQEIEDSLKNVVHSKFKPEHSFKKNKKASLLDVSESTGAYKDIVSVMKNQEDLVEIVTELKPFISMKG